MNHSYPLKGAIQSGELTRLRCNTVVCLIDGAYFFLLFEKSTERVQPSSELLYCWKTLYSGNNLPTFFNQNYWAA
ncbi:MAG: hypothetical protein EBQ70_07050 [Betaproteobacteria bacterium]|nr:hypothetical protein [Betaproteobacteria bacterium]